MTTASVQDDCEHVRGGSSERRPGSHRMRSSTRPERRRSVIVFCADAARDAAVTRDACAVNDARSSRRRRRPGRDCFWRQWSCVGRANCFGIHVPAARPPPPTPDSSVSPQIPFPVVPSHVPPAPSTLSPVHGSTPPHPPTHDSPLRIRPNRVSCRTRDVNVNHDVKCHVGPMNSRLHFAPQRVRRAIRLLG